MSVEIFSRESGSFEQSLTVNDDGSVTYWESNSGWRMVKRGTESRSEILTPDEAKARWPNHAEKIDHALAEIQSSEIRDG